MMQAVRRTLARLWKSIRTFCAPPNALTVPVDLRLRMPEHISGEDLPPEDGEVVWAAVSRHGLVQGGITCPCCGGVAASKGEFEAIHETRMGEAVNCTACRAVLLASPDDDLDPVKPGQPYDGNTYHAFQRPPGWTPFQRTIDEPVRQDSWIVITTSELLPVNGVPTCLRGSEGRVMSICEGRATVALSGNSGFAGSDLGALLVDVPIAGVSVMLMSSFRAGDMVEVTRGPEAGTTGTVVSYRKGHLHIVTDTGAALDLPIERLRLIRRAAAATVS